MVTAKHLCPTCGYKIERKPNNQDETPKDKETQAQAGFWSKLVKWDFASHSATKADQEKPAIIS